VTRAKKWFMYIVRCNDHSLYCGITTDIKRRVHEHNKSPKGAKYTRSRRPVKLVAQYEHQTRSDAMKAEIKFKSMRKSDKEKMISLPSSQLP
jgi:putative endonuclease